MIAKTCGFCRQEPQRISPPLHDRKYSKLILEIRYLEIILFTRVCIQYSDWSTKNDCMVLYNLNEKNRYCQVNIHVWIIKTEFLLHYLFIFVYPAQSKLSESSHPFFGRIGVFPTGFFGLSRMTCHRTCGWNLDKPSCKSVCSEKQLVAQLA